MNLPTVREAKAQVHMRPDFRSVSSLARSMQPPDAQSPLPKLGVTGGRGGIWDLLRGHCSSVIAPTDPCAKPIWLRERSRSRSFSAAHPKRVLGQGSLAKPFSASLGLKSAVYAMSITPLPLPPLRQHTAHARSCTRWTGCCPRLHNTTRNICFPSPPGIRNLDARISELSCRP
jgi:hypothetical protein